MAVVPSYQTGYEYNYSKDAFSYAQTAGIYGASSLYTESQPGMNWQNYPSQIAPVNSAMNSLFPPFSRGSTQKVNLHFFLMFSPFFRILIMNLRIPSLGNIEIIL